MQGIIKWHSDIGSELGSIDFNTDIESIRDTIVYALCYDWDTFGEDGDTITIVANKEEK